MCFGILNPCESWITGVREKEYLQIFANNLTFSSRKYQKSSPLRRYFYFLLKLYMVGPEKWGENQCNVLFCLWGGTSDLLDFNFIP